MSRYANGTFGTDDVLLLLLALSLLHAKLRPFLICLEMN